MAHNKKRQQNDDKMDQLINLVSGLATEIKNIKQDVDNIKNKEVKTEMKNEGFNPDAIIDPNASTMEFKIERETPYKVIPIQSIIRDEGYVNPADAPNGGVKKIYMGMGRTFKNKAEATAFLDRMKTTNPGQQYDIFPV